MEEARFSWNIKYRWQGFECQSTIRSDEDTMPAELIEHHIRWLSAHGAVPNGNGGNGKAAAPQASARVCPVCSKDDELELVHKIVVETK